MVDIQYEPEFAKIGKKLINPHQTGEENVRATDIMLAEKEKELSQSSKARSWEEGRKKEWKENKPYYMKSREKADPVKKILDDIYNGGRFKSVTPAANLLLIKVDEEEQTSSGLILPTKEDERNTGVVVDAASQAFLPSGNVCNMPYKQGDHVLYRKFAGMQVDINGKKLLMLTLQDILGMVEV